MPMSRKDYEAIAKRINHARDPRQPQYITTNVLIALLCGYLKQTSPRFNAEKFKEACLKEEEGE